MATVLPVGEARIWTVLTASLHADAFLGSLSSGERAIASRMHGATLRRDYVVAHALARAALTACEPAVRPDEWTFVTTEHGRPELGGQHLNHQLRYNIAHTADVVACVVTRAVACGIDVESVPQQFTLPARRVLSVAETASLTAAPAAERPLLYTRLWTVKEAYAKARGLGLLLAFDQLHVTLGDPPTVTDTSSGASVGRWEMAGGQLDQWQPDRGQPEQWQLDQWCPTTAHVATTAVASRVHVVHASQFPQ